MSTPFAHHPSATAPDSATLERLAGELRTLAAAVAQPRDHPEPLQPVAPGDLAGRIRAYLAARRARDLVLGPDWFADPAWDILLDLLACEHERRRISISSACIAAAVPATTALRWLEKLVEAGAIQRSEDPMDRRRAYVALEPELAGRLEQWVARHLPSATA